MIARWAGIGGWEQEEGIETYYNLVVTEQSWDVKYSIGNTVNNIVITMVPGRY